MPKLVILCLLLVGASFQARSFSQTPVPPPAAEATLDTRQLSTISELTSSWRFHPGDDPAYASALWNDSDWPLLKPNELLADQHVLNVAGGYVWVRTHLHILNSASPLAIRVSIRASLPFEVYANGRSIFSSPSMQVQSREYNPQRSILLPPASEILLAIRIYVPKSLTLHYFPIDKVEIGHVQALADSTSLENLHAFVEYTLAGSLDALLFLTVVPIAFTLFIFQRHRTEYFALGVFALVFGFYYIFDTAMGSGVLPLTMPIQLAYEYIGWLAIITGIEFIARFAHVEQFLPVRIFQAIALFGPLVSLASGRLYMFALVLAIFTFIVLAGFYLVRAWRRGHSELTLLLPPIVFWSCILLFTFSAQTWPQTFPWASRFHIGPVGVSLDHVGSAVFIFGIVAVVLYRFIRVSRDEQRAASELEAARSIQQILIPDSEALPQFPGLTIQSVYQPAQTVGGDFFQILPGAAGACLIVVGDVAGKGMSAAMTVSVLVGAIRTLAEITSSPAEILASLNRRLYGRNSSFTTCIVLNVATDGEVHLANAGHLQPYLGGQELLCDSGLPLGFVPDATYTESRFVLPLRQRLTLVTDGVVEATHPQTRELFGFDRTLALSTQSAQSIASAAQRFGHPAAQADDITILTLTRG